MVLMLLGGGGGARPLSKKDRWERCWWRQRSGTWSRKRPCKLITETLSMGTTNVGINGHQPLTWDVVNLGESERRESVPLRDLGAHFLCYRKPGSNSSFSSCSCWNKLLKVFFFFLPVYILQGWPDS